MTAGQVTTGLSPLTVGSLYTFELAAYLNHLPWDLTGGACTLTLKDPTGATTTLAGTGLDGGCKAASAWAAPDLPGTWTRSWSLTDAAGLKQVQPAVAFAVAEAP